MKIGVISDLHLGYYPSFLSRVLTRELENQMLKSVFATFKEENVDLIAILGDLIHSWRGSNGWVQLIGFIRLLEEYKIPAFMIRGNHDIFLPKVYEYIEDMTDGRFITFVGLSAMDSLSPIKVEDEFHTGEAYEKLMELNDVVGIALLPHISFVMSPHDIQQVEENILDVIRKDMDRKAILFAHYFLRSRVGGLIHTIRLREPVVPDGQLKGGDMYIFTGHDHRQYHSSDGKAHVIGSLLPRDARLGGRDVSFGIIEVSTNPLTISYRAKTVPLPYHIEYRKVVDTVDELVSWISQVLEEKELLSITEVFIVNDDFTTTSLMKYLSEKGIDIRRVQIRRVSRSKQIQREGGKIVELKDVATLNIVEAFNQYIETTEIPLPNGIDKETVKVETISILSELLRGDVND